MTNGLHHTFTAEVKNRALLDSYTSAFEAAALQQLQQDEQVHIHRIMLSLLLAMQRMVHFPVLHAIICVGVDHNV